MINLLRRLLGNKDGTAAIETAIVAPVLVVMCVGVYEVGSIVSRQHDLQSAANEATIIVMAANQGPTVELSTIKQIIATSVGLPEGDIAITQEYRCNAQNGKVKTQGACPESATVSNYIQLSLADTYTPSWTYFGLGKDLKFKIERSVQLS